VEIYISPLRKLNLLPSEKIISIFGNSEEIYKNNQKLLVELGERVEGWHVGQTVGDIFLRFLDGLEAYVRYRNFMSMGNLSQRTKDRSVEIENFFKIVETMPQMAGPSLQDRLTLPIQRPPHYAHLLQELYSHTPNSHPDHSVLAEVIPHFQKFT